MKIQLSDHFDYKKIIRFSLPSIGMMVFTSIYGVVDGFFVSNYVGSDQFAAVNLIMPFLMILGTLGFMFGSGGSALVAMTLGMGDRKRADRIFSMLIYVLVAAGIVVTVVGLFILRPVTVALGAKGAMVDYAVSYARIILLATVPFMLQNVFQSFLVAAEMPKAGLFVTLCAGFTNMILDWLLMGVFKMGIEGAACATAASQFVGGIVPLLIFIFKKDCSIKFVKTGIEGRVLLKASLNGVSEFMTSISVSLVSMIYNYRLIQMVGQKGVAVYGVIMYAGFIFIAVYLGYSFGTAPIVGFNYGADNREELKGVFKKSIVIILTMSLAMFIISKLGGGLLAKIFVGYDEDLYAMTKHAFGLYAFSLLFSGINIYASSFFTALNNGFISGLISFSRTLFCEVVCVLVIPHFLGLDGVWLSVASAEVMALVLTITCLIKNKNRYHYI